MGSTAQGRRQLVQHSLQDSDWPFLSIGMFALWKRELDLDSTCVSGGGEMCIYTYIFGFTDV